MKLSKEYLEAEEKNRQEDEDKAEAIANDPQARTPYGRR